MKRINLIDRMLWQNPTGSISDWIQKDKHLFGILQLISQFFISQCSKQMIPGLLRLANFLWRSQSPISVRCLAGFIAHCRLISDFFAGNRETLSVSPYRGGIGTLSTDFLLYYEWWSSIVFPLSLYKREASLLSSSPRRPIFFRVFTPKEVSIIPYVSVLLLTSLSASLNCLFS